MTNAQRLLPGSAPGGTPPFDPLAAYVISWLRFEDVAGTTIPVDQIAGVTWNNSTPVRAVVSSAAARGGSRSLARPQDSGGNIAGGLFTTLPALIGSVWTLEYYHMYTARNFGAGSHRNMMLGNGTSHVFMIADASSDRVYLEYSGGPFTLTQTWVNNVWYHIAIVSDGTNIKTYIDHQLVHTYARNAAYNGAVTPPAYSPGRAYNYNGDFHNGYTDEPRLTLAARTPAQFLPLEGYSAPSDARARPIIGQLSTMAQGVLGGGVTVNNAPLVGVVSNGRTGDILTAGEVRASLSGISAVASIGTVAPLVVAYDWTHQDFLNPSEYQAWGFGTNPVGSPADRFMFLRVYADGRMSVGTWRAPFTISSADELFLDNWVAPLPPTAFANGLIQISADTYFASSGAVAGQALYPMGQSAPNIAPYWEMHAKFANAYSGTNLFAMFKINMFVIPQAATSGPEFDTLRVSPGGSYQVNISWNI